MAKQWSEFSKRTKMLYIFVMPTVITIMLGMMIVVAGNTGTDDVLEKAAAQERMPSEAATASEPDSSAAMELAQVETRVGRDTHGHTMEYWENACARFEVYQRDCAMTASQSACLGNKLGENPSLHLHICQDGYWNDPARYTY